MFKFIRISRSNHQRSEDAISVVDANGMLINPAYTRLTGLSREDVIGKPADVVEKEIIKRIYAETNGNKTETIRRLGLSIRNLYYKMEKYQLA